MWEREGERVACLFSFWRLHQQRAGCGMTPGAAAALGRQTVAAFSLLVAFCQLPPWRTCARSYILALADRIRLFFATPHFYYYTRTGRASLWIHAFARAWRMPASKIKAVAREKASGAELIFLARGRRQTRDCLSPHRNLKAFSWCAASAYSALLMTFGKIWRGDFLLKW